MKIVKADTVGIKEASSLLKKGKLVAFPTETVFGVASIYNDLDAYHALNKLKRRNPDKPYTVMLSSVDKIKEYACIDNKIEQFLNKILPGSVTILLKAKKSTWKYAKKDDVIGIRIPSNDEALNLLKEVNTPLLVPSLNRSGESPLKDINIIEKEFSNELDCLIIGYIKDNVPSTVISLIDDIKLIREGKVSFKYLKELYESL